MCFPGNHVEEPRRGKPLRHILPLLLHDSSSLSCPLLSHLRLSPFPTLKLWRHGKSCISYIFFLKTPCFSDAQEQLPHSLCTPCQRSLDPNVSNFLHYSSSPFLNWEISRWNVPWNASSCPCFHSVPGAPSQRWCHTAQWPVESSWEGSSAPTGTWKQHHCESTQTS